MKPIITVLAYNRHDALSRLLVSLDRALYIGKPELILSLEADSTKEVSAIAKNFKSEKLKITVIEREKKLGLRNHVIECADLSIDHGSVIVLEDDLVVDPYFYIYAHEALRFYEDHELVSGIALYGHEYNEISNLPFKPMYNGYSTYFMQTTCSWGQCWSRSQWQKFKNWYGNKKSADLDSIENLPQMVKNWPESSWKKYFNGYIVSNDKYFVYPYRSLATNCSDAGGTHITNKSNIHQVSLGYPFRSKPKFNFCPIERKDVVYDAYMEPIGYFINRALDISDISNIQTDFYGTKPLSTLKTTKYAVTVRKCENPIKVYGYDFRPPEMNLIYPKNKITDGGNNFWYLVKTSEIKEDDEVKLSYAFFSYFARILIGKWLFDRIFSNKKININLYKLIKYKFK